MVIGIFEGRKYAVLAFGFAARSGDLDFYLGERNDEALNKTCCLLEDSKKTYAILQTSHHLETFSENIWLPEVHGRSKFGTGGIMMNGYNNTWNAK